ncbi:MAG: Late embryosis abundant protein [Candidatus Solibacter sp.]|jgi:ElaB/YqjD/DUF883 family membrane-anchored ribosome-binding protein|nr:Late embryosis abundant protein [Candidatus Solibacter sp.]
MDTNTSSVSYPDSDLASNAADKISDAASQAKNKVADLGRTAAEKIDNNRQAAAGGLQDAASTLREKADSLPGGEKVSNLAHSAADKLNATAEYVREHDVNSMVADLEQLVRNNPGPALLGAAVIGFLVGRAFSNND